MKTVRVWMGCKVVGLLTLSGDSSAFSVSGGAETSTVVDIELDPWAGLIVDHSVKRSPVNFREREV